MQKPARKARKTTRKTTRKTVPKTTELVVVETLDAAEARAFPPEAPEQTTENSDTNPTAGHSTAGDTPDLGGASFEGDGITDEEQKPTGPQLIGEDQFFLLFCIPFATVNGVISAKHEISLQSLALIDKNPAAKEASDALYKILSKIELFQRFLDKKNENYGDYATLAMFAFGMFSSVRAEFALEKATLVNAPKKTAPKVVNEPEKSEKQPKTPGKTPGKTPENMNVQEVTSLSTVVAHEY